MSEIEDDPDLRELARRLRESEPLPPLPDGLAARTVRAIEADEAELAGAGRSTQAPEEAPGRPRQAPEETPTPRADPADSSDPREATAASGTPARAGSRRLLARLLMPLMGAALLATLLVLGATILLGDPPGELEVETTLAGTDAEAQIAVREIGAGRVISLQSDQLEVLPTGEYYEVWFVGPGDTPQSPNRISAGTFHPDPLGRTDIELFGAVDPEKLPRIEITAEPGDGDPSPSGDVVVSGG